MNNFKLFSIVSLVTGAFLFLVSLFFRHMHYPDLFKGLYSGPFFVILGFVLLYLGRDKG
jgi:uncharacterized membrane protein YiaA